MKEIIHVQNRMSPVFIQGLPCHGQTGSRNRSQHLSVFSRNPRGGDAKPLDEKDIENYLNFSKENGLHPILAHAPYTLNACSPKGNLRAFAKATMVDIKKEFDGTELSIGDVIKFQYYSNENEQNVIVKIEKLK